MTVGTLHFRVFVYFSAEQKSFFLSFSCLLFSLLKPVGGTGNFTLFLKNLGISNFIILLDYLKNAHEKFLQG